MLLFAVFVSTLVIGCAIFYQYYVIKVTIPIWFTYYR